MNLNEILSKIEDLAEEGLELPAELNEGLKDKIDGYFKVLEFLEAEGDRYALQAIKLHQRAGSFKSKAESLRNYMFQNMKAFGWEEIRGEFHKAKIVKQQRFMINKTVDPRAYAGMPFVIEERLYKFDQALLKSVFEKDPELMKPICEMKESEHLRIT